MEKQGNKREKMLCRFFSLPVSVPQRLYAKGANLDDKRPERPRLPRQKRIAVQSSIVNPFPPTRPGQSP